MPQRGRKRKSDDGYEADVRPWPYVIIYEITRNAVLINGVMHTSRDRSM